ncbi:hypothetical protein G6F22_021989 [Rhizopus arrhizus]|nr:hypothetical protein G6F22_021989 [Rhizopus arrhizus]
MARPACAAHAAAATARAWRPGRGAAGPGANCPSAPASPDHWDCSRTHAAARSAGDPAGAPRAAGHCRPAADAPMPARYRVR